MPVVDVLIGTYERAPALAVTLTALNAQTFRDFRVIVSDQSEGEGSLLQPELRAVVRLLELHGKEPELLRHLPRLGLAEQRNYLLSHAEAPYVLFLDDDLILEPGTLMRMLTMLRAQECGFVGAAPIGLSYRDDVRPDEQVLELWEGRVQPEVIVPDGPQWQRHKLHNAANPLHVQERLGLSDEDVVAYKVAWVGGCVLYDAEKLRDSGGFGFWGELPPEHCGEDVLAQLRVMSRYGGCGILPSGVYHMELPTTVPDRRFDAPHLLQTFL